MSKKIKISLGKAYDIIKKPLTEDYKKRSVVINNGVQNLHKSMDVICPYSSILYLLHGMMFLCSETN